MLIKIFFYISSLLILTACSSTTTNSLFTDKSIINSYFLNTFSKHPKTKVFDNHYINSNIPYNYHDDIWIHMRMGFQLPNLDNHLTRSKTKWYAKHLTYVERMINRSKLYLYYIVSQLEERHMPTELALLPFIESAYNPQALSIAKAAGMWQFIPGTGRAYNLKQNLFQDERRDVIASTDAALAHLKKLHDIFHDWYLALAAYNWGEGNIQHAINYNTIHGLPTDYLNLRIPSETREYIPKLQAVKNLIINPQNYGLHLPYIPNYPYFSVVTTTRDIDVKTVAKLAHLSIEKFRALNPSFTKPIILSATSPQILLPFNNAMLFNQNLKKFKLPLSTWTTYTVNRKARPKELAKKIGIDVSMLTTINKIPSGMRLKPGSTLIIPKLNNNIKDISVDIAERAVLSVEPDHPKKHRLVRIIRHGSSFYEVNIRHENNINKNKIHTYNLKYWHAHIFHSSKHILLHSSIPIRLKNLVNLVSRTKILTR